MMARSNLDRHFRIAVSGAFIAWCSLLACSSDGTDVPPELQDGGGEASFDAPPPQPDAGADATRPDADPPDADPPDADSPDADLPDADPPDSGPKPDIEDPNNPMKDTDCDGLTDAEEFSTVYPGGLKTDPGNPDTDGDGILDGVEVGRTSSVAPNCAFIGDQDPTTRTSPVRADTDGDKLSDGIEDRNHNGRRDAKETDPNSADTDGDGVADGDEDKNGNGVVDPGETDPLVRDN